MAPPDTVIVIQARMTSARLPGKVLLPLMGRSVLAHVLARAQRVRGADAVCLAIPQGTEHEPLAQVADQLGCITVVRGPETDVLARYVVAIRATGARTVVRITSDCPFLDVGIVEGLIALQRASGFAYVRNAFESGLPQGLDAEVIAASALIEAHRSDPDSYEREHVTPFLWRRPERFPALLVDHKPNLRRWRLTLDNPEDYEFAKAVYTRLYNRDPYFGLAAIKQLLQQEPGVARLNSLVVQKAYEGNPDAGS